jgi:H+/Cl- antiporter ClcA
MILLIAIYAAIGGFISRRVFKRTNRNTVRKHTLMEMAGALATFFGSPLGGSLFALEVHSRFGVEYFEHMIEAIFCGEFTLAVFRYLTGLPIAPIWDITNPKLVGARATNVVTGALIGLLGAALFAKFHKIVMRGLTGAIVVVSLGMLIPQTMFRGKSDCYI